MKNRVINKRKVHSEELTELDLDLKYVDFSTGDEELDSETKFVGDYSELGDYIQIDRLIKYLQDKKKQTNCNYVSMDSHYDHHGYEFEFFIFNDETKEEKKIRLEKEKSSKRLVLITEKERYEKRLSEINDELKKIK